MNNNLLAQLLTVCFLCHLTMINSVKAATNIEDLVNQGKLTVSLQVNQQEQHIVGQALILAIEVSTDRWFATGSQIQHFTLKNTVMQANNTITINGSKRINGQTWATQTHEITLYPRASGNFRVAPINVDISVNTESDGIVSGVLSTQESSFTIELPEALIGIDNFIVSSQVTVNIDGHFDEEKDYAVGEAITQTITITASDTPAMMISPINLIAGRLTEDNASDRYLFEKNTSKSKTTERNPPKGKSALTGISGLSIYHKPALVFDKSNRGSLLGTRVESFTYIFEKPGSYRIDEQVIYWWNSQSNTLEHLLIPSSTWSVSGGGLAQISASNALTGINITVEKIIIFFIAVLVLTLVYISFTKRHDLFILYNKMTKREQRLLRKSFLACVTKKNYLTATQYLYQYALITHKKTHQKNCPLSEKLNQLAFNDKKHEDMAIIFSVNEAKTLINKIDASSTEKIKTANFTANERINLNNE